MGDLQAWVPQSNGDAGDGNPQPPSAQQSNPEPSEISAESWRQAEQATQEVVQCIQPTAISEQRRRVVLEYVQKLIRGCLATEASSTISAERRSRLPPSSQLSIATAFLLSLLRAGALSSVQQRSSNRSSLASDYHVVAH